MEHLFRADFSSVRVHESSRAEEIGARAFARGEHLYFSSGELCAAMTDNDALLAHELTHVVQQREGRAKASRWLNALPVADDPSLEREAEEVGEAAARGDALPIRPSHTEGSRADPQGPIQGLFTYYNRKIPSQIVAVIRELLVEDGMDASEENLFCKIDSSEDAISLSKWLRQHGYYVGVSSLIQISKDILGSPEFSGEADQTVSVDSSAEPDSSLSIEEDADDEGSELSIMDLSEDEIAGPEGGKSFGKIAFHFQLQAFRQDLNETDYSLCNEDEESESDFSVVESESSVSFFDASEESIASGPDDPPSLGGLSFEMGPVQNLSPIKIKKTNSTRSLGDLEDPRKCEKDLSANFLASFSEHLEAQRKKRYGTLKGAGKRQQEIRNSTPEMRSLDRMAFVLQMLKRSRICTAVLLAGGAINVYANKDDSQLKSDLEEMLAARSSVLRDQLVERMVATKGKFGAQVKPKDGNRKVEKTSDFTDRLIKVMGKKPKVLIHQGRKSGKHAEMRAADAIYRAHLHLSGNIRANLGISKLCCGKCFLALGALQTSCRIQINFTGAHFSTKFSKASRWEIPDFLLENDDAMKAFLGDKAFNIYEIDRVKYQELIRTAALSVSGCAKQQYVSSEEEGSPAPSRKGKEKEKATDDDSAEE